MGQKRKPLSKKIRFEVFKRDSFICQYCGKQSPDVVLNVDHIKPHSEGGSDSIMNLITSCYDCNAGKGKRTLSDDSIVAKSKAQANLLNDRRQQIEMMMEWHKEVQNQFSYQLEQISELWSSLTSGYKLTQTGKKNIEKLISKYGTGPLLEAMKISARQYLKYDKDGNAVEESVNEAFDKIGGILRVEREAEKNPIIKDIYYIKGILRNRMYVNENYVMELLKNAVSSGINVEKIKSLALAARNWTDFRTEIEKSIESCPPEAEPKLKTDSIKVEIGLETTLTGDAVYLQEYLDEYLGSEKDEVEEVVDALGCCCGVFMNFLEKENYPEAKLVDLVANFLQSRFFTPFLRVEYKGEAQSTRLDLNRLNTYLFTNLNRDIPFYYYICLSINNIIFPTPELYKAFAKKLIQMKTEDVNAFKLIQIAGQEYMYVNSLINIGVKEAIKKQFEACGVKIKEEQLLRLMRYFAHKDILDSLATWVTKWSEDGEIVENFDPDKQYSWDDFLTELNVNLWPSFRAIAGHDSPKDYMSLYEDKEGYFEGVLHNTDGTFSLQCFNGWSEYLQKIKT